MRAWGVLVIAALLGGGAFGGARGTGEAGASSMLPGAHAPIGRCDWPTWGYSVERPFATSCHSDISARNVRKLRLRWFFNTRDVVTSTPAVVGDTVYVGDWSGRVYALRKATGRPRWTFAAKPERLVYSGQIVGSPAVADVRGVRTVFVPSGKTMYALRASDGSVRWKYSVGKPGSSTDPTEIESSPAVVDGLVVFGFDVHNSGKGFAAGIVAVDARTGRPRWKLVTAPSTGEGATGSGCGDVWGSPAVDRDRGLVIFGTGNCVDPAKWGRFSDALVAVSLADGTIQWTYQPHRPNQNDLDFAGAPNLMDVDGTPMVGLGNKDGVYYVVDRTNGAPVHAIAATGPGLPRPGGNYSTGGFIGPAAYRDGVVVGGTAVGPAPFLHGMDVARGTILWQNQNPSATYGASAITNDVAIVGGTGDFTLRAFAVDTGRPLWSHLMKGAVAGGVAITRGDVFAVAGIREPGLDTRSRSSGVYRFALRGKAAKIHIPPPPSSARATTSVPQECVGSPCDMGFDLKKPPAGLSPTATLEVTERPFRVRLEASGLGPPAGWLRPGTPAATAGASQYAVFVSESDDNPTGGLVCILDASFDCTGTKIPRRGATYNRVSIVAVRDRRTLPTLADGYERLVTTHSFDPPLAPSARK